MARGHKAHAAMEPMAPRRRFGTAKAVVWLCSAVAVAAAGGTGMENLAPGAAVSAVPAAAPSPTARSVPREILKMLPAPGKRRLRSFFEAFFNKVKGWTTDNVVLTSSSSFLDDEEARRAQATAQFPCRPSRRPGIYGRILENPPMWMLECVRIATEEVFKVNHQIVDISYGKFGGLEALLLSQRRGPVQYMEVVTQGDFAHYEVNRLPLKTFRDHSCLDRDKWCFVSQVRPSEAGFLVVDRHRVIAYNYTWLVEGNTAASDIPDVYVSQFGTMNANEIGSGVNEKLNFPTAVAEYVPYNMTLVSLNTPQLAGVTAGQFEITPLIPHAWCRLLFVTDTGNHRVLILNASNVGQFDYIGQFGVTGEQRDNSTGLNWPWGVAVYSPAWEGRYEPAYANVFVVDRRNHRLVKLNLGYPLMPCEFDIAYQVGPLKYDEDKSMWMCRRYDKPRLSYSAEYGRTTEQYNRPRGLTDPTAVAVYKHYIAVAEVGGNAITVLRVDHQPPYGLKYVTYFKPVQGVNLQGGMSASPFGYFWYNYQQNGKSYFGSMFLPENMRESKAPSRFEDFLDTCVNISWYNELIPEPARFVEHMSFIMNASVINWMFPDMPGFVDLFIFNKSGKFDIDGMNNIVFNGTMKMCDPPTTPTPPPFFGGNAEGWVIDGKSQSEFTKRNGAVRSSHAGVALITSCISALLLLVLP